MVLIMIMIMMHTTTAIDRAFESASQSQTARKTVACRVQRAEVAEDRVRDSLKCGFNEGLRADQADGQSEQSYDKIESGRARK
jgi:hypothetical protein